jgi:hypothetical protein
MYFPYDPRYPISPPSSPRAFPRAGFFPADYGRVSPPGSASERMGFTRTPRRRGTEYPEYFEGQMDGYGSASHHGLEFPDFQRGADGGRDLNYPRGADRRRGGFWNGGEVGEWEVWW